MTKDLLILRPVDSASGTVALAEARGFKTVADPLFKLVAMSWDAPDPAGFNALMLTSANALHYGGTQLHRYRDLPVLAVGEKTAVAARDAGFTVSVTGSEGAQQLVDSVSTADYRHILRLTGKQYTPVNSDQVELTLCRCYEAKALSLGPDAIAAIGRGAVILLHSARAATVLQDEMARLGVKRAGCTIAALSQKIARAAGAGWADIAVADVPTDDALLDAAGRLCLQKQ